MTYQRALPGFGGPRLSADDVSREVQDLIADWSAEAPLRAIRRADPQGALFRVTLACGHVVDGADRNTGRVPCLACLGVRGG